MLPTWNLGTKNRGIFLSWNLVTDWNLGTSWVWSGCTDVHCTYEINTENLIRLNKYDWT